VRGRSQLQRSWDTTKAVSLIAAQGMSVHKRPHAVHLWDINKQYPQPRRRAKNENVRMRCGYALYGATRLWNTGCAKSSCRAALNPEDHCS
jgi:hypothetical protein